MFLRRAGVAVLLATAGCGGGSGDGGGGPPPSSAVLAKAGAPNGDGQTGPVAQPLADSFRVVVTEGSAPRAGVTVAWASPAPGASLSPASVTTDANGRAASRMTAGTVVGSQTARASIDGGSVTFTSTATPGPASRLVIVSGDGQAAHPGTALVSPLRIRVFDQFSNLVSAAPINWAVVSGVASLSASTSLSGTDGVASVSLTVGAVGPIRIRAVSVEDTAFFTVLGVTLIRDVLVRNNFFESVGNGSQAPSVDTIPAGEGIRWVWQSAEVEHNVISQGTLRFPSSQIARAPFTYGPIGILAPGTYHYECSLHTGMSGILIVE